MGDPEAIGNESQHETEVGIEAMQVVIEIRAENVLLRKMVDGKCSQPVSRLIELKVAEARRQDAEENRRLRGKLLEHSCSCVGTAAAESGFGLEPERHEETCGYRLALAATQGGGDG